MNKRLAEATENGEIVLRLGRWKISNRPISRETAEFIIRDLKSALDQATINETEMLKRRPMPELENFYAKLRVDLKDAYGELYHSKGSVVMVYRRVLQTGTAESVLKYPYAVGSFYVDGAAFDPL